MDYSFLDLKGKRTLFWGDLGTGKTTQTSLLVDDAVKHLMPQFVRQDPIVVLDFAPDEFTDSKGRKAGGKLKLSKSTKDLVKYFSPERVHAPRLTGKTREEILFLAQQNLSSINSMLGLLPSTINSLFINDISIYFHAGSADRLIRLSMVPETFIANGYRGKSLADDKGSGVSERESIEMEKFSKSMDRVITLS